MKPYSQRGLSDKDRIFNYRLSRARRVVENAFGILAHRWRCLLTCLQLEPRNVTVVVEASLTLHNLLRTRNPRAQANDVDREDENGNLIPGAWREHVQLTDPRNVGGCHLTREGKIQRNFLSDYSGRLPPPWTITTATLGACRGRIGLLTCNELHLYVPFANSRQIPCDVYVHCI